MQSYILWILLYALGFGIIGAIVGSRKDRAGAGFALGFVLGIIGLIIVSVMSPSEELQAARNKEMFQSALAANGSAPMVDASVREDVHKAAIAAALDRDPSLGDTDDPEVALRLADSVSEIEKTMLLQREVDMVKAERAQVAERDAKLAELAAQRERYVAEANEREAARAASRAAKLQAMSPWRRWIATHIPVVVIAVIAIFAGLMVVSYFVFGVGKQPPLAERNPSALTPQERLQLAQETYNQQESTYVANTIGGDGLACVAMEGRVSNTLNQLGVYINVFSTQNDRFMITGFVGATREKSVPGDGYREQFLGGADWTPEFEKSVLETPGFVRCRVSADGSIHLG